MVEKFDTKFAMNYPNDYQDIRFELDINFYEHSNNNKNIFRKLKNCFFQKSLGIEPSNVRSKKTHILKAKTHIEPAYLFIINKVIINNSKSF